MQIVKNKYTYWKKVFRRHPAACLIFLESIHISSTYRETTGDLSRSLKKIWCGTTKDIDIINIFFAKKIQFWRLPLSFSPLELSYFIKSKELWLFRSFNFLGNFIVSLELSEWFLLFKDQISITRPLSDKTRNCWWCQLCDIFPAVTSSLSSQVVMSSW